MATTKTTRMDAQGRVILPPHIRKELNLNAGQLVTVSLEGGTIKIQPAKERCAFCGEAAKDKYLVGPKATLICGNCARAIATTVRKEEQVCSR